MENLVLEKTHNLKIISLSVSCNSVIILLLSLAFKISTSFLNANDIVLENAMIYSWIFKYFTRDVNVVIHFLQANLFYLKIPLIRSLISDNW